MKYFIVQNTQYFKNRIRLITIFIIFAKKIVMQSIVRTIPPITRSRADRDARKHFLIEKLKEENRFWSYAPGFADSDVPDDIIIEKTLVYLDLDEIRMLFELYGKQKVKHVWLERLVPQGDYLYSLNRFFAWFYFRVKKPDMYVKSMETRILNRRLK